MSLFAMQLMANQLPTKKNLVKRGNIKSESQLCIHGCGVVKTLPRLFYECSISYNVWGIIFRWLGVSSALSNSAFNHTRQFSGYKFVF